MALLKLYRSSFGSDSIRVDLQPQNGEKRRDANRWRALRREFPAERLASCAPAQNRMCREVNAPSIVAKFIGIRRKLVDIQQRSGAHRCPSCATVRWQVKRQFLPFSTIYSFYLFAFSIQCPPKRKMGKCELIEWWSSAHPNNPPTCAGENFVLCVWGFTASGFPALQLQFFDTGHHLVLSRRIFQKPPLPWRRYLDRWSRGRRGAQVCGYR